MTILAPAEGDLVRTDFRPITGPETGFLKNYRVARERTALAGGPGMVLEILTRQINPFVKAYEERTGKKVRRGVNKEPKFERGEDGVFYVSNENYEYQALQDTVIELGKEDPNMPTWEEITENIPKMMREAEAQYFDTVGRQTTLGLIGEISGDVVEDINQLKYAPAELAFWLIGKRAGPGFKPLVKAAMMDSAAAAMAVGSRQPSIKYFRV